MQSSKRANDLRSRQTDTERLLWSRLRNRRLEGYKFRRQLPVGRYIVDFVCISPRLIVELDGSQHARRKSYDQVREQFLRNRRYQLVRIASNEVLRNLEGVLMAVWVALRRGGPSPRPSPWKGEGAEEAGRGGGQKRGTRKGAGQT
jgi:very-short-patch-repair endonuclease